MVERAGGRPRFSISQGHRHGYLHVVATAGKGRALQQAPWKLVQRGSGRMWHLLPASTPRQTPRPCFVGERIDQQRVRCCGGVLVAVLPKAGQRGRRWWPWLAARVCGRSRLQPPDWPLCDGNLQSCSKESSRISDPTCSKTPQPAELTFQLPLHPVSRRRRCPCACFGEHGNCAILDGGRRA